jgi:hypothetical protein
MNQATATQQHKDEEEVIGQEFQKLPGYVSPWSCSSRTTLAGDAAGVWDVIWPVLITPDGKSYVYSDYRILSELHLANGLIWRPSFERQRDFNPPEQRAAQRALPVC